MKPMILLVIYIVLLSSCSENDMKKRIIELPDNYYQADFIIKGRELELIDFYCDLKVYFFESYYSAKKFKKSDAEIEICYNNLLPDTDLVGAQGYYNKIFIKGKKCCYMMWHTIDEKFNYNESGNKVDTIWTNLPYEFIRKFYPEFEGVFINKKIRTITYKLIEGYEIYDFRILNGIKYE